MEIEIAVMSQRHLSSRRMAKGIIGLCVAGLLTLCGSVLAVGLLLSRPHQTAIGPPPADLSGTEMVRIASGSGSELSGWWIPGRRGSGCVVLMHGVGANRSVMLRRARMLRQNGVAVLLFDFQAHGE